MRHGQVPETRNCTSRQGHSGPRGKARFGFGLEFSQAHVTRTRRDTLTTPRTRPAAHGYAASPSILTTAPSSSDVPSSSRSSGAARQSGYASRRRLAFCAPTCTTRRPSRAGSRPSRPCHGKRVEGAHGAQWAGKEGLSSTSCPSRTRRCRRDTVACSMGTLTPSLSEPWRTTTGYWLLLLATGYW